MLKQWRVKVNTKLTEYNLQKQLEEQYTQDLKNLETELDLINQAREIFKKAALVTQNHLAEHLSQIVTKAIKAVFFEKDIFFRVKFVERRNTTECDFWIEENGKEFDILESRGYGMADVASFALRVAYVLLSTVDNVILADEPGRNISINKQPFFSQMISELSKSLDIQFIIATHVESMKEFADKSFHIVQKDGVSAAY